MSPPGDDEARRKQQEQEQLTPKKWGAMAAAMICVSMTLANSEVTTFAANDITGGLGAGQNLGAWAPTAYWFGDLLIIPFTLLLSQIFTPRWWLVVNIALYAAFCALSGLMHDISAFLAFRFLQGLTGGALSPLALFIALTRFVGRNRPLGLLIYGVVATAVLPLMALLAGWGVVYLGWGGTFMLILGPALVAIGLAIWSIDEEPIRFEGAGEQDWMGALIYGGGLALLAGALQQSVRVHPFDPGAIWAMAGAGLSLLALFLVHQLTWKQPLTNLRLARRPEFALGLGLNALSRFALLGYSIAIPAFLTAVRGLRPEQFGQALALVSLPQVLAAPLLFYLAKRLDERWIASFGLALLITGLLIASRVAPDWGPPEFAASFLLQGMGQSFLILPVLILVTSRAREQDTRTYNIMFNSVRDFGTVFAGFVVGWTGFYRSHLHSERIAESSSPSHPAFAEGVARLLRDFGPQRAPAILTQIVTGQITTLTEADVLRVLALILFVGLGLAWLIPKPPPPTMPLATVELDGRGLRLETPEEKPPQPPPPDQAAPEAG